MALVSTFYDSNREENTESLKPQNYVESIIWHAIIWTYPMYFIGAQYIVVPGMACILAAQYFQEWLFKSDKKKIGIYPLTNIPIFWIVALSLTLIALVIGHLEFGFGKIQIIKSAVEFYKQWWMFPLFMMVGHFNIRATVIYRAVCILCLQSLVLILIGTFLTVLNFPDIYFISPLSIVGGSNAKYGLELLHSILGQRLSLFTAYPTYLGTVGNIFFWLSLQEKNTRWKSIGIVCSIVMISFSASRSAVVCLPFTAVCLFGATHLGKVKFYFYAALASFLAGLASEQLLNWVMQAKSFFYSLRSGSSDVRSGIYSMTIERWFTEAPIWGHGISISKGPQAIAFMPFGSHHNWFGLLYNYGLVGCISVGLAFFGSLLFCAVKAQCSQALKVSLAIFLILLVSSMADNIEFFSYNYWEALVVVGIALKDTSNKVIN